MNEREPEQLAKKGLSKEAAGDIRVIAKGGGVQVVGQISQRSLAFFFAAAAVRILGQSAYGLYRIVFQVLNNVAQLGLLGFNFASMRFITKARARGDHGAVKGAIKVGLWGAAIFSAAVALILFAAAGPVARFFKPAVSDGTEVIRLIRIGVPFVFLFALMQVLRYCTQAYKTMVPSVVVGNLVQPGARFVFGLAALAAGFEIAGVIISLEISVLAAVVVAAWYLNRMLTEQERTARTKTEIGPMIRFALPQTGASLLGVQTLGLGVLLLGRYDTAAAVGAFAISLNLQGPGNVFLGGIVNIWAPVVSDLHERGEIERLGALYQTINRWIATFSLPVFAALMIMPEVFVKAFAGSHGAGAASVVAILAVGNVFYTSTGPTGYVISMTGRPGVNFLNSAVAVAAYVLLGIWVVPEHGAVGMAVVDAVVTSVINSIRVIEARLLVGVQPFGRTFYKPVVATLAGAAVLLPWRIGLGHGLLAGGAGIAVAGGVYLLVLKLLGMDEEERHVLERIKKRAIRRRG